MKDTIEVTIFEISKKKSNDFMISIYLTPLGRVPISYKITKIP